MASWPQEMATESRSSNEVSAEIDTKGVDPHIREAHMTDLQPA